MSKDEEIREMRWKGEVDALKPALSFARGVDYFALAASEDPKRVSASVVLAFKTLRPRRDMERLP